MAFILSRDIFYILIQKHAPPPVNINFPTKGFRSKRRILFILFQQILYFLCIFNNFSLQWHDTEMDLEQVKIEQCLIVGNSNTQPDLERTIVSLLIRHCLPGGYCV